MVLSSRMNMLRHLTVAVSRRQSFNKKFSTTRSSQTAQEINSGTINAPQKINQETLHCEIHQQVTHQDQKSALGFPEGFKVNGTYHYFENTKDNKKMEKIEKDVSMNRDIDIKEVNNLLKESNNVNNYRFGPRIYKLIKEEKISPNHETFEELIASFIGRKNLGITHMLVRVLEKHKLWETPKMRNHIIRGYLQYGTREHQVVAMCLFGRKLKTAPTDWINVETYVILLKYRPNQEAQINLIWKNMLHDNIQPSKEAYEALIIAYTNIGLLMTAERVVLEASIATSWGTDLEGALIKGMANNGYVQEAIQRYRNMKKSKKVPPPTAIQALIKNIAERQHSAALGHLLNDLPDDGPNFEESCKNAAIYYLRQHNIELVCYYLKMGLRSWPENVRNRKDHYFDEVFYVILAFHMDSELGVELLEMMKKDIHALGTPSRKGLDLLWHRIHEEGNWRKLAMFWKEYATYDLNHNIMNEISGFKAAIDAKDYKSARAISDSISSSHPAVWTIIRKLLREYGYL